MEWMWAVYAAMFVITWGGTYSYFTNTFPTIDSPLIRRQNLAAAIFFALFSPVGFIVSLFWTGFYYHGFQWYGCPKNRRRGSNR